MGGGGQRQGGARNGSRGRQQGPEMSGLPWATQEVLRHATSDGSLKGKSVRLYKKRESDERCMRKALVLFSDKNEKKNEDRKNGNGAVLDKDVERCQGGAVRKERKARFNTEMVVGPI